MNHTCSNKREIYLNTLWEDFINKRTIKQVDLNKHVWTSWNRSRAMGIRPYQKGRDIQQISQIYTKDELQEIFQHIITYNEMKEMIEHLEKHKCTIAIYNEQCKYIACLYSEGNDMKNMKNLLDNMSENLIGTNAVACCAIDKMPCEVIGGEHYITRLKQTAGYAAPYKDCRGNIVGVIYTVTDCTSCNDSLMDVTKQIAELFDKHAFLHSTIFHIQDYIKILEGVMEHAYEGIIFIDKFQVAHGYNQKALEMLEIDESSTNLKKEIYNKLITMNAYRTYDFNEQLVFLKTRNKQKSFLASNQKIKKVDYNVGTIISLIDIEGMSKLHNKLKGNQATYTFNDIIGQTKIMLQLKTMAKKVADTSSNILINGESGTGKELMAQAIHNSSPRKSKPFIAINCGAMPSELIESELYGYEAGTFSGGSKSGKVGKMEFVSGGTLFLDEIESMPLSAQIKLLRAISTSKITRLGGVNEIPIDLRIIAATKKNLLKESKKGKFRSDLYYRIQVIELNIPPLRSRKEDIPLIVKSLRSQISQNLNMEEVNCSKEFMDALINYDWPGNVRELSNVIERALILINNEEVLTLDHLTEDIVNNYMYQNIQSKGREDKNKYSDKEGLYHKFEQYFLNKIMQEEHGNISSASKRLGLSRQTLYRKLRWIKNDGE